MIDALQTYATLIGLVIDIIGVTLLAREFIDFAVGGTRRLVGFQAKLNLGHIAQAKEAESKAAAAKASGANWFTMMWHDIGLAIRKADARLYAENVRNDRLKAGLVDIPMLGSDGWVNVDALHLHHSQLDEHYADIGKTGTIRPTVSRLAFGLIIGGFALQFLGALPLGASG